MKESEAAGLVARLLAAFPHPRVEPLTAEVYAEAIGELRSYDAALDAVNACIKDCRMLPRVAEVLDHYDRVKDRYAPKALPMPEMTEEERLENLERLRELTARYAPKEMA